MDRLWASDLFWGSNHRQLLESKWNFSDTYTTTYTVILHGWDVMTAKKYFLDVLYHVNFGC